MATTSARPLKWSAAAVNGAYCILVLAGALASARGRVPYWSVAVLLGVSLLGTAAVFRFDHRPLYLAALWVSSIFGMLGACALVFVLLVAMPNVASSNPIFVAAVSAMLLVPLFTALVLVHLHRASST